MNLSITTSFDKNSNQVVIKNSFEAETFEPELTFENTLNEIKYDHFKSIASSYMNLSSIASNKPS